MSVSDADISFAIELFESVGQISHRKMFGGLGLYHDDAIFAVVDKDGQIFVKAKGDVADELIALGRGKFHNMPYWSLPENALDDPEQAAEWVRKARPTL